jgi:hypothetical protein
LNNFIIEFNNFLKENLALVKFICFILLTIVFIIYVFLPSIQKVNTDFPNYYVSSNMLLDGKDLIQCYSNADFHKQVLLYGIESQIVSFIPYPPVNSLLMIPIAKLNPLNAKFVWSVLNLLFLFCCIYLTSKITNIDIFICALFYLISGFALINNFLFGQIYLLMLLLLLLSLYYFNKNNIIFSSLFLALSITLKFYTAFFLIYFLAKKNYSIVILTFLFIILIYIPVVYLTGFELNIYYFSEILPRLSDGWIGTVYAAEYQSMITLLHNFFTYNEVFNPNPLINSKILFYFFKFTFAFTLLIISFYVVFISKHLSNTNQSINLAHISLFCIISLLMLPVNASYQYVIIIPACLILFNLFIKNKKIFIAITVIFILVFINSPIQILVTNHFKNTQFYILAYIKLFGLITLFILNLKYLFSFNLINSKYYISKFTLSYALLIIVFTAFTYLRFNIISSDSVLINTGNNYFYTMPSVYKDKIIWVEPVSERFALKSNFGFEYINENVFNPVFADSLNIVFETIANKKVQYKKINIRTNIVSDTAEVLYNENKYNSAKTLKCFSQNGTVYISDLYNNIYPITAKNEIAEYPVFAYNDSTIIFASDKNRGVGFFALYKLNLNSIQIK